MALMVGVACTCVRLCGWVRVCGCVCACVCVGVCVGACVAFAVLRVGRVREGGKFPTLCVVNGIAEGTRTSRSICSTAAYQ